MIVGGPAITCGNGNKEDCTTNELPVPDQWVKPLYDAGQKDYHDLKISTTAKTPKRIPIAKPSDTAPKAPTASDKPLPSTGGESLSQKKDDGGLPDCAKTDP